PQLKFGRYQKAIVPARPISVPGLMPVSKPARPAFVFSGTTPIRQEPGSPGTAGGAALEETAPNARPWLPLPELSVTSLLVPDQESSSNLYSASRAGSGGEPAAQLRKSFAGIVAGPPKPTRSTANRKLQLFQR